MELIQKNTTKHVAGLASFLALMLFAAAFGLTWLEDKPIFLDNIITLSEPSLGSEDTLPPFQTPLDLSLPIFSGSKMVLVDFKYFGSKLRTSFNYDTNKRGGTITVSSPDVEYLCTGIFNYTPGGDGDWYLDCQQDDIFTGTLRYNEVAHYFLGRGNDPFGEPIVFHLNSKRE